MATKEMVNAIAAKYGKDSFEASFAQYVFSKRSTEYFLEVYKEYMGG